MYILYKDNNNAERVFTNAKINNRLHDCTSHFK